MFGAGKRGPVLQEDDAKVTETTPVSTEEKAKPSRNSGLYAISGLVALASLAFCFAIAIWVAVSDSNVYSDRLEYFMKAILYATVVYFASGTIWIFLKEKKEA